MDVTFFSIIPGPPEKLCEITGATCTFKRDDFISLEHMDVDGGDYKYVDYRVVAVFYRVTCFGAVKAEIHLQPAGSE